MGWRECRSQMPWKKPRPDGKVEFIRWPHAPPALHAHSHTDVLANICHQLQEHAGPLPQVNPIQYDCAVCGVVSLNLRTPQTPLMMKLLFMLMFFTMVEACVSGFEHGDKDTVTHFYTRLMMCLVKRKSCHHKLHICKMPLMSLSQKGNPACTQLSTDRPLNLINTNIQWVELVLCLTSLFWFTIMLLWVGIWVSSMFL